MVLLVIGLAVMAVVSFIGAAVVGWCERSSDNGWYASHESYDE